MRSRMTSNRIPGPIQLIRTNARCALLLCAVAALGACKDPNRPDLNNPGQGDFSSITDKGQVQEIVIGLLSRDRANTDDEILDGETIGRDVFNTTASDPRFISELLGPPDALDPSGFLGAAIWPYDAIHLADIAVHGIDAAEPTVLTDGQKAGAKGVIRTLKALEYIRVIETRDTTGAPINTDLPNLEVAPISCKTDVLNYIDALLDSAAADLQAPDAAFTFSLTAGFSDFGDPASFLEFNRALAAKVDLYRGFENFAASGTINTAALLEAQREMDSSFINTTDPSSLDFGAKHTYSTVAGDATNPLFEDPATSNIRANTRVVAEADANDDRVAEKITTGQNRTGGGGAPVSSNLILTVYPTNTSPIPVLTNKQLILKSAEIEWGLGNDGPALALSNFIRVNDGGLTAANPGGHDAILLEILKQERYSLLFESADRWIDARMFNHLEGEPPAGIGLERGNEPISAFPLPQSELDARGTITKECTS